MKKYFLFVLLFTGCYSLLNAQTKPATASAVKKETFDVNGNCGMCKKTIEKAARTAGASFAQWNMESHVMTVKFDSRKTTLAAIQQKIAASGYDNAGAIAPNEAYEKLHHCCKYERKPATEVNNAPGAMKTCCKNEMKDCQANCCKPGTEGAGCCKPGEPCKTACCKS